MAKFKKSFSALLVFTLLFATFATATVFPDVDYDYAYAQEVELLSDLGILAGFPDGTFGPEQTLTRVQASAVIFRMLTSRTDATLYNGPTAFSDVAASYWGTGYINFCFDIGAIGGYPDGTFRPDQTITVAEFESMLVRALGLTAGKNLAYPGGYIAIADANGINDGVPADIGNDTLAHRGLVAKLTYNTIENATYATIATADDKSPTILGKVFKISPRESVIYSVEDYTVGAAKKAYKGSTADQDAYGVGQGKILYTYTDSSVNNGAETFATIDSSKTSLSLLGQTAKIYVRTDGVDAGKAFAIVPSSGNKSVTLKNSEIFSRNSGDETEFYYKNSQGQTVYFSVNENTKNFLNYNSTEEDGFVWLGDHSIKDGQGAQVLREITLVSNDNEDKSVEFAFAKEYSIAQFDGTYNNKMYFAKLSDVADDSVDAITLKVDNTTQNVDYPSNLTKGDGVMVYRDYASSGTEYRFASVTPLEKANGELSKITGGNTYTIGGTDYKMALQGFTAPSTATQYSENSFTTSDLSATFGLLLAPGFHTIVQTSEVTPSIPNYFYVTGAQLSKSYGSVTYEVQGYTLDGTKKEYVLSAPSVTGSAGSFTEQTTNLSPLYDVAFDFNGSATNKADVYTAKEVKAVFEISTNNKGEISSAKVPTGTPVDTSSAPYNKDLDKNSFNSTSFMLAGKNKVVNSSVFFFDEDGTGENVKVYVGSFPAITSATVISGSTGSASIPQVNYMLLQGVAKGSTSSNENIHGVIISKPSIFKAEEDSYYAEFVILSQGEKKTLRTEAVEKSDLDQVIANATTNALMIFDVTSDGHIVVDSTPAETFTFVSEYATASSTTILDPTLVADNVFAVGGVTAMDSNLIGLGEIGTNRETTNYYTLSSHVVVYELDTNNEEQGEVAATGAIRTLPTSNTTDNNKVVMVVFNQDSVEDVASGKGEIVAIYYVK